MTDTMADLISRSMARSAARTPEERDAMVQAVLDAQPKELPPEVMERLVAVARRLKLRSA